MLEKVHVCLYFISISYVLDTDCLDDSASYLNVCDPAIGRKYEFKAIDATLGSVRGRLKRALHEWKIIDAPQFILEVIEFGYKLPFISIPAPKVSNNNRSALAEVYFVEDAIQNLLPE